MLNNDLLVDNFASKPVRLCKWTWGEVLFTAACLVVLAIFVIGQNFSFQESARQQATVKMALVDLQTQLGVTNLVIQPSADSLYAGVATYQVGALICTAPFVRQEPNRAELSSGPLVYSPRDTSILRTQAKCEPMLAGASPPR